VVHPAARTATTTRAPRACERRILVINSIPRTYRIQGVPYMGNGRTAQWISRVVPDRLPAESPGVRRATWPGGPRGYPPRGRGPAIAGPRRPAF
jgi:hypothetical protein